MIRGERADRFEMAAPPQRWGVSHGMAELNAPRWADGQQVANILTRGLEICNAVGAVPPQHSLRRIAWSLCFLRSSFPDDPRESW